MKKRNTETSHTDINTANFKIIDIKFSNNKRKQKIAETLWIKGLRFTLNVLESIMSIMPIMDAATGELCNIGIIILIVYYPLPLQLLLSFGILLVYRFYMISFLLYI